MESENVAKYLLNMELWNLRELELFRVAPFKWNFGKPELLRVESLYGTLGNLIF